MLGRSRKKRSGRSEGVILPFSFLARPPPAERLRPENLMRAARIDHISID